MIAPLLLNGDERDAHGAIRLDSGTGLGLQWLGARIAFALRMLMLRAPSIAIETGR